MLNCFVHGTIVKLSDVLKLEVELFRSIGVKFVPRVYGISAS